jgi:hypothetical protein
MAAPANWVCDAAYSGKDDINAVAEIFPWCNYYAPPQGSRSVTAAKKHRKTDSAAVKKWRNMLGTDEMNQIYPKRWSTAEFSNAQIKNFGLREFLVRGIEKVKGMANLHAIAQNLSRYFDLATRATA